MEQLGPLLVFFGYQLIEACDVYRRRQKKPMSGWQFFRFRVLAWVFAGLIICGLWYIFYLMGYLQPLSSRIRGIVIKHQRTGNPLVDSVAEHQPSSTAAYQHYLHDALYPSFVG